MRILTFVRLTILSLLFVLCFASAALAVPQPAVSWTSESHEAVNITVQEKEGILDRCLDAGVEVRYRYEFRYCIRGTVWFGECENVWVEIKTIKFDPIKETYLVESDRLGDDDSPYKGSFSSRSDAMSKMSNVPNFSMEKLARGEFKHTEDRGYVEIRVTSDCKGSVGNTMLDISYYLTFGLVKISRFDSGWVPFYLKN